MGSIVNGISLTQGMLKPYGSTFLIFSRLHAPGRPALGARPHAVALGLDARLGRPRRGRPDAPAGRAPHDAPRDPEPLVRAARRRERDVDGVADRAGARGRPGRAGALAPEAADARPLRGRAGRGRASRRVHALAVRRRPARHRPARDRLRGERSPTRPRARWTPTSASSRCRAGSSSPSSRRTTATR